MLEDIFPRAHGRYQSLPLLGSLLEDLATWMTGHGYRLSTLRVQFNTLTGVDRLLRRRGARVATDITPDMLEACWAVLRRKDKAKAGVVLSLRDFLEAQGMLPRPTCAPATPTTTQVAAYQAHLIDVRGLSRNTVRNHLRTATEFLDHLDYDAVPSRLTSITAGDVEAFMRRSGERLSRGTLQHVAAHMRGFLRFLAATGAGPTGLDTQVDTPRLYRLENLPQALPWETVQGFLQSVAGTDAMGLRDYAMLLLIATYGLRVSEISALTLDDVHWRAGWIRIPSPKMGTALVLPLTDTAGTAIVDYLQKGRPSVPHREIFLRVRAPIGPLKRTAVSMVFKRRAKQSGLDIRFFGAHCLRHSYAVHLLRQGTSLKTIGDLLGHRTAEATCVYLRLATEDLREVPLPVPRAADTAACGQVGP